MAGEFTYLIVTVIFISLLHTVTGPDHYLPFIALSKTKNWSVGTTIFWTLVCGAGHVGSSVLMALFGAAFGWSVAEIKWIENVRGGLAGWIMLFAGIAYTIYAIIKLNRNVLHKHFETDAKSIYVFEHRHGETVLPRQKKLVTPWVMFIVFVLGPCEPLIPLLSYPAATHSMAGITIIISVFTLFTLCAMVVMVLLGYYGLSIFNNGRFEKIAPVLAGSTVLACGAGMLFMGW